MQLHGHKRLTPKSLSKISKADRRAIAQNAFSEMMSRYQKQSIPNWYNNGGIVFLEWVKKYYRRSNGQPLSWDEPYMQEFYLFVGNPWIEREIIEKSAQRGFTECMIALMAFVLAEIRVPTALGFEAEGKLRDIVNPRIQPSFDYIDPIRNLRQTRFEATRRKDTDFQQRKMTVGAVEMTLFYTSTVESSKNKAEAPSSMRSFPCSVGAGDEVELWSEKAIDIFSARFLATILPSKPMRLGSTPGFEGGVVDTQVKKSGKLFEWRAICPHCNTKQAVHPFGNYLKPHTVTHEDGTESEEFYDATGKPYDWHRLPVHPVQLIEVALVKYFARTFPWLKQYSEFDIQTETAYVGCSHCGSELLKPTLDAGLFEDASGQSVEQFSNQLITDQKPYPHPVAMRLPALASRHFKPAEVIRAILKAPDPADIYQQQLGVAVSIGGGKIQLPALLRCVGRKPIQIFSALYPEKLGTEFPAPDLRVIGMDQGKAFHWVTVQDWWLGEGDTWEEQWKGAIKQIIWYGDCAGFDGLERLIEKYQPNLIGIDGEPEVEKSTDFALAHPIKESPHKNRAIGQVFRFDQVHMKAGKVVQKEQEVQRKKVSIFSAHRTFGLDAVRNRIYRNLQCTPAGLSYNAGDEFNPIYHYLTSSRQNNGTWETVQGGPDHFFHADNFGELAVYWSGYYKPQSTFSFGAIDMYAAR